MELYAITIRPESPFGTPLKGDTIFGAFCWQAAEDPSILEGGLDYWIDIYADRPFAVFSSVWPRIVGHAIQYAVRRPEIPLKWFGDEGSADLSERLEKRKQNKARRWLLLEEDLKVIPSWDHLVNEKELTRLLWNSLPDGNKRMLGPGPPEKFLIPARQQHNTINRQTNTTGEGIFAPYTTTNLWFLPGMELVLFVAIDEGATDIEKIQKGLSRMGAWGFGRDASTGLGRFSFLRSDRIGFPDTSEADACLTLGPCVPRPEEYKDIWFLPFTRFGRHGASLMHAGRPFKNPIVMADEGAVLLPKERSSFKKPYLGSAVTGISKAQREAVTQGYTIYLPMEFPRT